MGKISNGRLKPTERSGRGSPKDVANAALVCNLADRQPRRAANTPKGDLS